MDSNLIPVYIIIALVFIGLPILLGRLTGSNPMEILFGDRGNHTIFGKKKEDGKDLADGEMAERTQPEKDGKPGRNGKSRKAPAEQKNSNKQELMKTISDLLTYGRKHHFFCVVPGTLMHEEEVASLAVLMVTRRSVLGFNCFGYGGTIIAGSGEDDWRQQLNGEEKMIGSPVVRNRKQKDILDAVLKENGFGEVETEIYGIFTASGVILKDHKKTRCCSRLAMMEILKGNRFLEDKGLDPQKIGRMLEAHTKKA